MATDIFIFYSRTPKVRQKWKEKGRGKKTYAKVTYQTIKMKNDYGRSAMQPNEMVSA